MSSAYQLFKDLTPAVESALLASIDRFGVLVPVAKDQHGNILDGHQRARLADSLGIKYPVNIIEVADDAEALEIARTLNEDRRAMPKDERLPNVAALKDEGHSNRAIAGALGVSEGQVRKDIAEVELRTGTQLGPERTVGLDGKVRPARREPKPPEEDILRFSAAITRERLETRHQRHIDEGRINVPPPSFRAATFRVIYADPPWRYDRTGKVNADWGEPEDHYPSMSLDDMKKLPIGTIAMRDSALFLWATSPMLDDAVDLMGTWGFKYKSSVVWDKGRPFLGSYVHISHELLLIGTRGSCVADAKHTSGSVFAFKREEHSRKPEEFRALIDSMYTYGNRIELFRRGGAPEGWHVWGNESGDG